MSPQGNTLGRLVAPTLSTMQRSRTLIAVPAFNEARTVDRVLRSVAAFGLPMLVIDDGSTDETAAKVAGHPVELVRHAQNEGYGAVMRAIFAWSAHRDFDWVITMDCDDQHEPAFIPNFLREIARDDVDVVSGSRYLTALPSDVAAPADRAAINRTMTAEINELLGGAFERPLTDSFCGFKAYRVHACHALRLTAAGYEFPMQFWVQAAANRLRVREIPVVRIYLDVKRSFGNGLDDPTRRLAVYRSTLESEVERCAARLRYLLPTTCSVRGAAT
jgi:dolichol-phosphate mannosyltransferase